MKKFRRDAENQTTVLATFQMAGWARRIHNPFPYCARRNGKVCRRETVRSLNNGLTPGTIRFHCDGIGGIRWEEVV